MKIFLFIIFLSFSFSSNAQGPLLPVQNSCGAGIAFEDVKITQIPMNEITLENNFRGNLVANYSIYRGREIGYAKNLSGALFVIYGKSIYPIDKPILIDISMEEYKDGLMNGNFEFNQIADWSILSHKGKRFLCIALSQPMTKAMTYVYLLDLTSKPRNLYFSGISVSRRDENEIPREELLHRR